MPGTFVYSPPAGTILDRGNQLLSLTFTPDDTNYAASSATQSISVLNNEPSIVSALTASPNPATTGAAITFTAPASDPDYDTLAFDWNFGDGATGTGASPTHIYGAPGTYTISVVLSDANGGSASDAFSLSVIAAGVPGGLDTDGDGFTDAIEVAAGSQATNAADRPLGVAVSAAALPLGPVSLKIKLNFKLLEKDSLSLSGTLPLSAEFQPKESAFLVDVGGVAAKFTLNEKGSAKTAAGKVSLKRKGKGSSTFAYKLQLGPGNFSTPLGSCGLIDADLNTKVFVPLMLVVDGHIYQAQQAQAYSAKAGKSGSAKMPR
ncbi:MAG TPA: PKD domain-containing protein [Planctomycetota bacterium]|nr:PKD domain-containing protein [Planctomycetota bacterium]